MTTIKESAEQYEPPKTLNVADLKEIDINLEILNGEGKDKNGEVFKYKYAVIDGKEYRIAGTILGGIKKLLERRPNLKRVEIIRDGEGIGTRYQVIPAANEDNQ